MAKRGRPKRDPNKPPLSVLSVTIGKKHRRRLEKVLEARRISASAWMREKIDEDAA